MVLCAQVEIFKLMERDAYARFKNDKDAVGAVVDEFFASADVSNDGYVTFEEYRKWVLRNPEVIVFFSQLSKAITDLIRSAKGAVRRRATLLPQTNSFVDVANRPTVHSTCYPPCRLPVPQTQISARETSVRQGTCAE